MALYLTARQVADRWGCSMRQVQRLCTSGELRAMRLGSDWRITTAAVEAYEAAHANGSEPSASIEAREPEPIRTVFGALEEGGMPLALPERWWEGDSLASPAAGRGRSTGRSR